MSYKMFLAGVLLLISTLAEAHESIGSVSNGVILVRDTTVEYYLVPVQKQPCSTAIY